MATKSDANVTAPAPAALPFHPLFAKNIVPRESWNMWLKLWSEARTLKQLISRLHCGFDAEVNMGEYAYDDDGRLVKVPVYNDIDRLIFYFEVAEGWRDTSLLRKPGERDERYSLGYERDGGRRIDKYITEIRQMVATKAFDMLCPNFFNGTLPERVDSDEDFPHVWYVATSERLLPRVMSFFRVQERHAHNPGEDFIMPNLDQAGRYNTISNSEKVATEFLLNLARFIWRWSPRNRPYFGRNEDDRRLVWESSVKAERARLDSAKPWMIEVLAQLDRLDILREWLLELDETCLAKLKEIAFRNKLYRYEREEERKVETLDEACYLGSKSAWLLKEYKVKKREGDRLSKIREARRQKAQADRTIAELSSKK